MAYANGQIPLGALVGVPGQSGLLLTPAASNSWGRVCQAVQSRYGWTPWLTDAYRALTGYYGQIETFLRRYDAMLGPYSGPYGDVRYWQGVRYVRVSGAAAAVPGASNHGWGLAVDCSGLGGFSGTRYQQLAAVAIEHGWSNAEGRRVDEAWHWVYSSSRDIVLINNPGTGPGDVDIDLPDIDPLDPLEEDVTPQDKKDIATEVWNHLVQGVDAGGLLASVRAEVGGVHRAVIGSDAGENARDAEDDVVRQSILAQIQSARSEIDGVHKAVVGSDAGNAARLAQLAAQVEALIVTVKALSTTQGVDPELVLTAVRDSLKDARITLP